MAGRGRRVRQHLRMAERLERRRAMAHRESQSSVGHDHAAETRSFRQARHLASDAGKRPTAVAELLALLGAYAALFAAANVALFPRAGPTRSEALYFGRRRGVALLSRQRRRGWPGIDRQLGPDAYSLSRE